ncbi:MAG: crossover junction endodeoxyribonuclease RuvC, partial [Alphaproteobacteria bacterium]
ALLSIISKYQPDVISLEDLFFAKNAKTVIAVGEARGVILLAAAKGRVPVVSYTPLCVKRTITGDGHADKKQMEKMITSLLHLKECPKPDDTADALPPPGNSPGRTVSEHRYSIVNDYDLRS